MNVLKAEKRRAIVSCLVEGNSARSTARITGTNVKTVLNLMASLGVVCKKYQDENLVNLNCKKIQADEIWCFCYGKANNLPENLKYKSGYGDVWTWVAIDEDTKLIPCWHIGKREMSDALSFMMNLARRVSERVQIATDGFIPYVHAVHEAFGKDANFAQLVKIYAPGRSKYNPNTVIGTRIDNISGDVNKEEVSTSFVERQNLTMRMGMRRYTRATNAFSKKLENLKHAVSLHFMHYNFCRVHQTIKMTPAMKAGITDHVWSLDEVINLLPSKRNTT